MSTVIDTTPIVRLRSLREELALEVAEAAHNLAVKLANTSQRLWALPTENLLAILNDDLATTQAMLEGSHKLALPTNSALESVGGGLRDDGTPMFPARAPTERGRADIVFDPAAGQWVCLPPSPIADPEEPPTE